MKGFVLGEESVDVARARIGRATPTPFSGSTEVSFTVPREGDVKLEVYDVAGRLVRRLVDGTVSAGSHSVTWSGADANGRSVTPGIYFMRLETEHGARTRRVVLIR